MDIGVEIVEVIVVVTDGDVLVVSVGVGWELL